MSKEATTPYSKIPRKPVSRIPQTNSALGTTGTSGTTRKQNPNYQSRIERPSMSSLLRPPQKVSTIPRSVSGDTLNKIVHAKLPTVSPAKVAKATASSRLNTINLRNNDIISKINQNVIDDNTKMLFDETIDLIGSDDNLKVSGQNETVTLSSNGNVVYEIYKNNHTHLLHQTKILTNSLDSLNMATSSPIIDANDKTYDVNRTLVGSMSKDNILNKTMTLDQNHILNSTQINPHNLTLDLNKDATYNFSNSPFNLGQTMILNSEQMGGFHSPQMQEKSLELKNFNKKMIFNSTMTNNLLLDITQTLSPNRCAFDITQELADKNKNTTQLLYMTTDQFDNNELNANMSSDSAENDTLVMEVDEPLKDENAINFYKFEEMEQEQQQLMKAQMRPTSDCKTPVSAKQRYSFGLDFTECTLDCSIEFCDVTVSSTQQQMKSPCTNSNKQNSFDMDESLGILTPDQMKEFLDSNTTNTNLDLPFGALNHGHKSTHHQCRIDQTPSPEELPLDPVAVKTDTTDMMIIGPENAQQPPPPHLIYQEISQADSDSKTDQMTKSATSKVSNSFITSITSITSLDTGYQGDGEMSRPASRGADHSPSIGPKMKAPILNNPNKTINNNNHNGNNNNNNNNLNWNVNAPAPVARRQDPMTDSDFFTESDADDVFNRGDRRAQVIDGQLYGPMLQGANVFINQQPQTEDSCMESSGIFTDVENRGDDDLLHRLETSQKNHNQMINSNSSNSNNKNTSTTTGNSNSNNGGKSNSANNNNNSNSSDMSPDISSDTISSSNTACSQKQMKMEIMSTASDRDDKHQQQLKRQQQQLEKNESSLMNKTISTSSSSTFTGCSNLNEKSNCGGACDIDAAMSGVISDVAFGSTQKVTTNEPSLIDKTHSTISLSSSSSPTSFLHKNSNNITNSANNNSNSKKFNSRKQLKNETNLGLKKHDMSSRNVNKLSKMVKTIPNNSDSGKVAVLSENSSHSIVRHVNPCDPCENQENKRPGVLKKCSGNKWDAVMNKIAVNKSSTVKKNFSEVKSKVACGAPKRSPRLLNSPPSEDQSVCSGASLIKRTPISTKRGRTQSKDSQQSSQSDLSLSGGGSSIGGSATKVQSTPKSCVVSRSAKKRDVRTINSSASDLGPPSKSNGTTRITPKTISLQKRISPITPTLSAVQQNINNNNTSSNNNNNNNHVITDIKVSSPPKKINPRRLLVPVNSPHVTKSPLKDHNRLVVPTPTAKVSTGNSPKSSIRSQQLNGTANSGTAAAIIQQQQQQQVQQQTQQQQQLLLSKATAGAGGAGVGAAAAGLLPTQHQQLDKTPEISELSLPDATSMAISLAEINHSNKTVEALGVLIQHFVFNLDVFSIPMLRTTQKKLNNEVLETKKALEKSRSACQCLEDQLADREAYFTKRESELQELHRCEISKMQSYLDDLEVTSGERIGSLENEIANKDLMNEKKLAAYCKEVDYKFADQESQLKLAKERELELLQRISVLTCTEDELREKVHTSELDFSERLHAASLRERELNDQISSLSKQLSDMKQRADDKTLELEDELTKSNDELSILRRAHSIPGQKSAVNMNCSMEEIESLRCVLDIRQKEISELRKRNQELQHAQDDYQAIYARNKALESRIEDLEVQLKAKIEEEKELYQKIKVLNDKLQQETKDRKRLSLHNEELQYRLKQNSEKYSRSIIELSKSCSNSQFLTKSTLTTSLISNKSYDFSKRQECYEFDEADMKGVVEKSDSMSWIVPMDAEDPEPLSRLVRRAESFRSTSAEKCSPSPLPKRQKCQFNKVQQSASSAAIMRQSSADESTPEQCPANPRVRSKSVSIKMSEPVKSICRSISSNAASTASKYIDIPATWNEQPLYSSSPNVKSSYLSKKLLSESQKLPDDDDDDDDEEDNEEEEQNEENAAVRRENGEESVKQMRLRAGESYPINGESEIFHSDNNPNFKKCRGNRGLITCDTSTLLSQYSHAMSPSAASASSTSASAAMAIKGGDALNSKAHHHHRHHHHHHHPKKAAGEAMVSGSNSEDESGSSSSTDDLSASSNSTNSNILEEEEEQPNTDVLMQNIGGSLSGVCNNDTPMEVSWSEDGDQSESNV